MMKRFVSLIVVVAFALSMMTGAYAAEEPTQWKQYDKTWGSLSLGDNGTMGKWGCLVTSIAIQMARANVVDSTFTPGTLRDRLEASGYISHNRELAADGNLAYAAAFSQKNSPDFYYCGAEDWTTTSFKEIAACIKHLQDEGYYVIAQVKYGGHYVACGPVDQADVAIYDPGYDVQSLKAYDGGIQGCIYFKPNNSVNEQHSKENNGIILSNENTPSSIRAGSTFSLKGNIASEDQLKHVVVGVYRNGKWVTGKCSMNIGSTTYDIAASADLATHFEILEQGDDYVYRITAITESDERIVLLEAPFSVY